MKTLLLSLLAAAPLVASDLDPATMAEAEWTEYRLERSLLIRDNPELAKESLQLENDTRAQARAVEEAMVKADPSIAPILARVSALVRSDWNAAPAPGEEVTVEQWQKLRDVRADALQASPDLAAANAALRERKAALDQKVDDALAKADPGLAPFIHKLNTRSTTPSP